MRTVLFVAIVAAIGTIGCHDRHSLVHDADGNTYAFKGMSDGRTWMTDNLRLGHPNSYCYNDAPSECIRYGRLYAWAAAVDACRLLGSGWQLPTDEEWRQLAKGYGGVRGDATDDGHSAYAALLRGGASGFNGLLSGNREVDGSYARIEQHGFYWSASQADVEHAWFYNFGRGGGLLNRHGAGDKAMALAVRCIKAL